MKNSTEWVMGADSGRLRDVIVRGAETPKHDSVVIRGNGIGALTMAARLSRSESFAGKVVIAGGKPKESRQLINGCTLRARSIDYYAAALGTSRERVLNEIYQDLPWPIAREQRTGYATENPDGSFTLKKVAPFMRSKGERELAYGVRNTRLGGAIAALIDDDKVIWHDESPDTLAGMRELATGQNPLLVNAGHKPLTDVTITEKPTAFVVASQMTFTEPRRRELGIIPDQCSFAGGRLRNGGMDIGVFYPFADPASPEAKFYGIFYRIVQPGPGFDKKAEIAVMHDTVVGVGRGFGIEPHDEAATLGEAMVPAFRWADDPARHKGYVDLYRIYSAGMPIITGCGMSRGGLAGLACAEAVLRGADPVKATDATLGSWRRMNQVFAIGMAKVAPLTAMGLQRAPGLALSWLKLFKDQWAGLPSSVAPAN